MSKYVTGSYLLTLFGKAGNRLDTESVESFTSGTERGTSYLSEGVIHSFVVSRVVYNSLEPDVDHKWVPKEQQ